MMYQFMTLEDTTEIVHSAECYLPSYEWKNIDGFSKKEIDSLQEFLQSVAHIVIRLARKGGFDNATNF